MTDQTEPIIRHWKATGELSDQDQAFLKDEYKREIGAPPDCQTCGNVLLDIRQYFFYQLLKIDKMSALASKTSKYILLRGFLMLPGDNIAYVSEGPENDSRTILTDQIAEDILARYPSYEGTLIGINRQYESPVAPTVDSDKDTLIQSLTVAKEAAEADNKSLRQQVTTLKGQLTKATNERDALKEASTAQSVAALPETTTLLPVDDIQSDQTILNQAGTSATVSPKA